MSLVMSRFEPFSPYHGKSGEYSLIFILFSTLVFEGSLAGPITGEPHIHWLTRANARLVCWCVCEWPYMNKRPPDILFDLVFFFHGWSSILTLTCGVLLVQGVI